MSNVLDRAAPADLQASATVEALDDVFGCIAVHMKPKAIRKARDELEAFATRLETWEGRRLPVNVTPLRGPRGVEQARASEARRVERVMKAQAIRAIIGRVF